MADSYTAEWFDECWGRIVIAIGRGEGKNELISILAEAGNERFAAGEQHERDRRAREITEKLLGPYRTCETCQKQFLYKSGWDSRYCDDCSIPF